MMSIPSPVPADSTGGHDMVADFVRAISQMNNGAIEQIGDHVAGLSSVQRARFIERCASIISAAAEVQASPR